MIRNIFNWLNASLLARWGPEHCIAISAALDKAAVANFRAQVIQLGLNARVRHPIYLKNSKYFQIGNGFGAGPGLRIEAWDEFIDQRFVPIIKIGNNVGVNWNVHIGAINRIEIQDNVLIGSNVLITDHHHGQMTLEERDRPPYLRRLSSKGPVVIEENVLIGENVSILSNVIIGRGSIVGANSLVNKNVPAYTIVGGVPAKVLKHLD